MIVPALSGFAVLISAALSLRASGRLPADARVPVHAGPGGWDSYVSRNRGLWEWPIVVAVLGAILSATTLAAPAPPPVPVMFGLIFAIVLAFQWTAFRAAEKGAGGSDDARPHALPKWLYIPVIALAVIPLIGLTVMFLWPRGGAPTEVRVAQDQLVLTMRGPYKAFSLRSEVQIRLDSVVAVRADPHARNLPRGFRVGTSAPGVIAGRFTSSHCRGFWAIDDGSHAVVIDLRNADFDRVVVEVEDPGAVVAAIRDARPFTVEEDAGRLCGG